MSDNQLQSDHPASSDQQSSPGHVMFCITELDPGGAERALVRVARGLHKAGWRVQVVSLRDAGALARQLEADGITVTALGCGGFADLRAVFRLRRLLIQQRPQLLVCFLHQANIVGRLAGWLAGVRSVVAGVRVADRRRSVIWTDRLTRCLTSEYVAVSRHVADVHARLCRVPEHRMHVIYNGVDVSECRPETDVAEDDRFRILFVGRLTAQKRPQDLVSAVSALPRPLKDRVVLDLVGDGELKSELHEQIQTLNGNVEMQLHGYQSNVDQWMSAADLLVLPSAWEGLPNVVLEAMAHGLPVVATDVDGVSEIVEDGTTGWLVPAGHVRAMSETIERVAADDELRHEVARRAFAAVQQRFCWDAAIQAWKELLTPLLSDTAEAEKSS